jgi:hypothetical protein
MPLKFRKKPVVIEAFCWTGGTDQKEDPTWIVRAIKRGHVFFGPEPTMHIRTIEGVMIAHAGDWIIRGEHGELYPCKPDIFAQSYEPA